MKKLILLGALVVGAGPGTQAGEAHDLMRERSESDQLAILGTAVRSSGNECREATRHVYIGDDPAENVGYWTVACGESDYMVSIGNAGHMRSRVTGCTILEAIDIQCWRPF